MSREIEEMRDILDGSSASEQENDDDQEGDTPSSHFSQSSRGLFIFSPTADSTALHSLYPSSSDLLTMFDVFQQNVDPVARIFHCPTLRTTVTEALPLLDGPLDRHTGLVLFSISYAALTSLDDDECQRMFGEERRVMLPRYRYAVEQSLVRARFLDSQNLAVLTSLVLFLLCVRRHDNSRFVSSLLGVVIRNAQAMGLHRDGTNFQLSPYETEMRRRVWWHICVLDLRASEDHGCDPSIYDQNYDTKFPLSINDEDISPSDTVPPPERVAGSDMIFCLLRFEVAVAIRRLNYPAPVGSHKSELSVGQKRRMVETVEKHFYERYIHRCDITKSFDWVSATWAKLMLAKMWLAVSNPLQPHSDSDDTATTPTPRPVNMRSLAFEKSVEVLELSDLLETGHRAARWRWLFLTHFQWHAVVFVLAHLCVWPADELARRAWVVVDRVWERWSTEKAGATRGMLWKPIRRLMDRAQQIRAGSNSRHEAEGDDAPEPIGDGRMPISFSNSMARYEDPLDDGRPDTMESNALDQFNPHEHLPMQVPVGDLLDETLHSEWTEILHELQMGFQDGDITMDLDAIQGYGGNFWNTL
ncbi:hypothetical protein CEP51_006460 [Fusarium floridanum]|uniref:Xylanolytic transcriptional activator regulatory domain-containing protein n=1 Tax=Fusarium floridanum TaxID=1325733 RepID=A0A428RSS9_9HYPO|nr:hypothetical protein CEP51_006460 [Fusarium floridanum]